MATHSTEEVVNFGDNNALIGILSSPKQISKELPAVIVVNAGLLHRVGPCRSTVILARELAARGYAVLRFDYSGTGDSGFSTLSENHQQSNAVEVIAAIEAIELQLGIHEFVIHGLCSGATDAFATALADARVVGISQIDGHAYRNFKYQITRIRPKIFSPGVWHNSIKHRFKDMTRSRGESRSSEDVFNVTWQDYPQRSIVEEGYRKLLARNVKFLVIFTGSWNDVYNYDEQFFDMYSKVNFGDNVMLKFMPHANHVMAEEEHQQEFFQLFFAFITDLKT